MDPTFEFAIDCPECGDDAAHLLRVEVHQNRDLVQIDAKGVRQTIVATSSGRGSSVLVYMSGECGHTWCERMHFHKGKTYGDSFCVDDPGKIPGDECGAVDGLWRD